MEFSNEVIEVFEYLGEKMGIAIDWTSENVIPYITNLCDRFVHYELVTSALLLAVYLIVIIVAVIIGKAMWKHWQRDDAVFGIVIMTVVVILGGFIADMNGEITDILQCIFLPELQIYEFITNTAASMK